MSEISCPRCGGSGSLQFSLEDERVQAVLERAAGDWSVTIEEICGPGRRKEVVAARRQAARELRLSGLPLKTIALWLGGRHHTTVINLLNEPRRNGR